MSTSVKICGITDKESLHAAIEGGASFLGFVFVPTSKRAITPAAAQCLLGTLPHPALCRFTKANPHRGENDLVLTALFVDPTDEEIRAATSLLRPFLGLIQLHGKETPERVSQVRKMTGLPIMKAISIADGQDFDTIAPYEKAADMLLFDTKLDDGSSGGSGHSFDWKILAGRRFAKPWMLAGGLNAQNVCQAIEESGTSIVDVSSGVETKGQKDLDKIKTFLKRCHEY